MGLHKRLLTSKKNQIQRLLAKLFKTPQSVGKPAESLKNSRSFLAFFWKKKRAKHLIKKKAHDKTVRHRSTKDNISSSSSKGNGPFKNRKFFKKKFQSWKMIWDRNSMYKESAGMNVILLCSIFSRVFRSPS